MTEQSYANLPDPEPVAVGYVSVSSVEYDRIYTQIGLLLQQIAALEDRIRQLEFEAR